MRWLKPTAALVALGFALACVAPSAAEPLPPRQLRLLSEATAALSAPRGRGKSTKHPSKERTHKPTHLPTSKRTPAPKSTRKPTGKPSRKGSSTSLPTSYPTLPTWRPSPRPVRPTYSPAFLVIVAGNQADSSCAIIAGNLKCWGNNDVGQLGQGSIVAEGSAPGQMGDALPFVDLGGGTVVSAALGGEHACAVLSSGGVKCWGCVSLSLSQGPEQSLINARAQCSNNYYGQLGLGSTSNYGTAPGQMGTALPFVYLGAGQGATHIAAGFMHTCALLTAGVKCWGCAQC